MRRNNSQVVQESIYIFSSIADAGALFSMEKNVIVVMSPQ